MRETRRRTKLAITDDIETGEVKCQDELIEGFGDELWKTGEEMIQIGFKNVNLIKGRIKASHEVFDAMVDKDIDIMGLAETKLNLKDKMRQEAQMTVQMRYGQGHIVERSEKAQKEG